MAASAQAGVTRNNYVDWVVVSSNQTTGGNFIHLVNSVGSGECTTSGNTRVRFSKDDSNLLSLFLTAKAANKKIGFYYKTTTSLPGVSGHGVSTCEITNAWLESD